MAAKLTSSETIAVDMTSSHQKENGRLRPKIWQVVNKISETKKRRDFNTYSYSDTSFSKLKFKLPGLVNTSWLIFLMYCLLMVDSGSASLRQKEKEILDNMIGPTSTYDKRIRPAGANDTDPVIVHINTMIRDIRSISDVKMEYSIQLTFREMWTDSRLVFDDMGGKIKYLTLTEPHKVWTPDLFFRNEREGHFHKIMVPNLYMRIDPHGGILYSIRLSLTLFCPMNFELFPLDRQTCQLFIASYGWKTEDLTFLWRDIDPVQLTRNLHLPHYTFEMFSTDYCNSKTNTGEYSCLRVDFVFKREFWYYLIQYYIPCCMLVIVSWVSFWLDENAVSARVVLHVATFITMFIFISSINQSFPIVSYTKAIDVWTGACLTFVFGALLEFAFVNYVSLSDKQRDKMKEKVKEQNGQLEMEVEPTANSELEEGTSAFALQKKQSALQPQKKNFYRTWLSEFPTTRSKRIDVISRITFPLAFAFFNIVYWSTY